MVEGWNSIAFALYLRHLSHHTSAAFFNFWSDLWIRCSLRSNLARESTFV